MGDVRMGERHLQIKASLDALAQTRRFVYHAALDAGLGERAAHHCALAVDEACTNVVEHGYGGNNSEQVIDITCREEDNAFVVTVFDDSPAFNPLTMPDPNPAASLNDRESGGWGIFFIKKLMDKVDYDRQGSRNRLVMVKKIDSMQEVTNPAVTIQIEPVSSQIWQIALRGWITAGQSTEVERVLRDQLAMEHKRLILNMSNVEYISSDALKILVGAWQRARESKGNLVLVGLNPHVLEMLQLIGLDLVFPIVQNQSQAIAQFALKKK
jgi:serine/threonine-protein kinase RsbW